MCHERSEQFRTEGAVRPKSLLVHPSSSRGLSHRLFTASLLVAGCAAQTFGGTATWSGTSGDGKWETPGNWSWNPPINPPRAPDGPGDDVVIPGGSGRITVGSPKNIRSLRMDDSTSGYSQIAGQDLNQGTGVTINAGGDITIGRGNLVTGGNGGGTIPTGGSVTLTGGGNVTNDGTIGGGNGHDSSPASGAGGSVTITGGSVSNGGQISGGTGGTGSGPGGVDGKNGGNVVINGGIGGVSNGAGGVIAGGAGGATTDPNGKGGNGGGVKLTGGTDPVNRGPVTNGPGGSLRGGDGGNGPTGGKGGNVDAGDLDNTGSTTNGGTETGGKGGDSTSGGRRGGGGGDVHNRAHGPVVAGPKQGGQGGIGGPSGGQPGYRGSPLAAGRGIVSLAPGRLQRGFSVTIHAEPNSTIDLRNLVSNQIMADATVCIDGGSPFTPVDLRGIPAGRIVIRAGQQITIYGQPLLDPGVTIQQITQPPAILTMQPCAAAACDPCDVNCDGSINLFDIGPFLDALSPAPPQPCSPCAADANGDGSINQFDVQAFVECLSG